MKQKIGALANITSKRREIKIMTHANINVHYRKNICAISYENEE